MKNLRRLGLVATTLLAFDLAACASGSASTRANASESAHEFIQGPHIASGTAVHVRLTQALDLASSTEGGSFEAALEEDLRTEQGAVLVRSGAMIRGRVAWSARSGRVTLRSAQVESPVGPIEIHAALLQAGQPGTSDANPALHPTAGDAIRTSTPLARQGGPESADPFRGRLACDTTLTLQLTRPLLAPGAHVLRD